MTKIEELLDEIECILLESARVPFTNKRMVEEDELARVLDELREVLPGEILEASRIVKERQHILDDAQKEAQNIVDQAKNYILKLTDENLITKQAQEQAGEMLEQARKAGRELQADAFGYAEEVFRHIEGNLENALEVVRKGHTDLQQSRTNPQQ